MSEPDDERRPTTASGRVDLGLYQLERGLITGALLVMTFTYFLQIVHREMRSQVNAFDRLFLRLRGFESVGDAPPGAVEAVTQIQSPITLGIIGFLMVALGLRTRERAGLGPDEAPPRPNWPRRLALSALILGAVYGFLVGVATIPSRWVCLVVLVGLVLVAGWRGVQNGAWSAVAGAVAGGGFMAWFFVAKAGDDYIWAVELSSLLLMYVGFLGASMATRDRKHIQVDALRKKIPARHLPLYNALGGVVTLAFCALLLVLAWGYLSHQIEYDSRLQATRLPEYVLSLPIVVAVAIMILRFGGQVFRDIAMWRRGEVYEPTGPEIH